MVKASMKIIRETAVATIYSFVLTGEVMTEFERFAEKYKDSKFAADFNRIVSMLERMGVKGVQERYFRPEGKMSDNVCALPVESCRLRLYCLRLSDGVLVVGNGGVKQTRTYGEDCFLLSYVETLQKLDALIRVGIRTGVLTVEETSVNGLEGKLFEI